MACTLIRCIFLLSCLLVIEVCLGRSISDEQVVPNSAEKVSVELYYETLCPSCEAFVLEGLPPLFKNGLIDIVDLKLVPWGNAQIYQNQSFFCQHGPPECFLNTVEACAIDAWPTTSVHFPFVKCVEYLASEGQYAKWKTCFTTLGLDPKPVNDCSISHRGTELQVKYATETRALDPPHEFLPWVVVNGQPLKLDLGNMIFYICKAYKGTLPSACHQTSFSNSTREQIQNVYPVCHAAQLHNDSLLQFILLENLGAPNDK